MMAQFTGLTIAAQARDESVARNLDKLVEAINLIIQSQQAAARRGQPGPNAGAIGLHKLDAKRPTYVLDLPAGAIPPQILAMFRPTVELGKGQLVIAATTEAADQAADLGGLPADRLWKPTGAFVPMARRLPRDLVFLGVSDARDTLPAAVEALPTIAAQLNLLFPAVNIGARGRPPRPVHQQLPPDRPGPARIRERQQRLPRPVDRRQGRQAHLELAGGDPALPRSAGPLRQVPPRRAVGQPAQQAAHERDAAGLRLPQPGRRPARHDDLPRLHGPRHALRGRQVERADERRRRGVQHDPGRRGQGGGALDEARLRPPLRPGRGPLALRRRVAPPGRIPDARWPTASVLHRGRFHRPEGLPEH